MARMIVATLSCLVLSTAAGWFGCGGLDVDREGLQPLKLLDLSPRNDETGVTPSVDVVAVFSDQVRLGEESGDLNERTFRLLDAQGVPVDATPELSELDRNDAGTEGGTALMRLDGLAAGQRYTVIVSGDLEGLLTDPLGVDVHATFQVAE